MTTTEGKKGKSPTHSAYSVREYGKGKSFWTKIGAVWPHDDGQGSTLQLEMMPLDGKVVIRPVKEKKQSAEDGSEE